MNKIVSALRDLVLRLQELITEVIKKMFAILKKFGTLAKEQGYHIAKVEFEIQGVTFKPITIFGVIPLYVPEFTKLKLTFSIEPVKPSP